MEVTIIIPVYNRADVVQATLDSVVAQTHRPLQLVLVDNCSTDNTLQVLETFRKEHPSLNVVITQEQHHTAGAARNRGFEQATGEWVLFFDSDDQMEPGLVASYYLENTGAGAAIVLCAAACYAVTLPLRAKVR